jgi:hypothetical protein
MGNICFYVFALLICSHDYANAEHVKIEGLFNAIKNNVNNVHSLVGTIEKTTVVNGKEHRSTQMLFYKRSNKYNIVTMISSNTKILSETSDGQSLYRDMPLKQKKNVLEKTKYYKEWQNKYDKNKNKYSKEHDYKFYSLSYQIEYNQMISNVLSNNMSIVEQNDGLYHLHDSSRGIEVWINKDKGIVTKYTINNNGQNILCRVLEDEEYDNVNIPTKIEYVTKMQDMTIVILNKWKNIRLNKDVDESNFIIK